MKRIPMLSAAVRALMFGMAFGIACTAAAQEKIVLRVADHLSLNHYVAPYQVKFWMQKVTEASGGKIQFEYYPAEQLGNATDYLKLVVAGVIDVSSNTPAYVSDKMPLSVVAELPGAFNTACVGTLAFWKLASNGGILDKEEFAPNGVRVLFSMVFSPYQIFTRKKFSRPEDFAGLKIQSSGGAKDLILRKIGAVPIRVTGPNIYESISRGTIDGGNLTYGSLISYNLQELAKFVTEGENFGSVVLNYVISEQRWMSLPPNVRQIMAEAGEATTRHLVRGDGQGCHLRCGETAAVRHHIRSLLRRGACGTRALVEHCRQGLGRKSRPLGQGGLRGPQCVSVGRRRSIEIGARERAGAAMRCRRFHGGCLIIGASE